MQGNAKGRKAGRRKEGREGGKGEVSSESRENNNNIMFVDTITDL